MASPEPALNTRQRAFVDHYSAGGNATQAAIAAGYSPKSARQQGACLCANPAVIEALRAKRSAALARLEVTEDLVLAELAAVAFSNLEDFVTWDESAGSLVVKPSAEIPRQLMAALESVQDETTTTTNKDDTRSYTRHKQKVKLYPKLEALKLLAEYLGLRDELTPKITVYLKTGIDRSRPAPDPQPIDVTPEPSSPEGDS